MNTYFILEVFDLHVDRTFGVNGNKTLKRTKTGILIALEDVEVCRVNKESR